MTNRAKYIRWFETLGSKDVHLVGGKNASLGEMIRSLKKEGIRVPEGFATTSEAYRALLDAAHLAEKIEESLKEFEKDERSLEKVGRAIRGFFLKAEFPEALSAAIRDAYDELCRRYGTNDVDVAVRSSATAEDLPEASFAGQQESAMRSRR